MSSRRVETAARSCKPRPGAKSSALRLREYGSSGKNEGKVRDVHEVYRKETPRPATADSFMSIAYIQCTSRPSQGTCLGHSHCLIVTLQRHKAQPHSSHWPSFSDQDDQNVHIPRWRKEALSCFVMLLKALLIFIMECPLWPSIVLVSIRESI